ncbi:hypothetical protein GQX74_002933 [Glossina fuscipes]|nr:hypothetical protein GQX74_002933 [Glossina fuscipes]
MFSSSINPLSEERVRFCNDSPLVLLRRSSSKCSSCCDACAECNDELLPAIIRLEFANANPTLDCRDVKTYAEEIAVQHHRPPPIANRKTCNGNPRSVQKAWSFKTDVMKIKESNL